MRGNRSNSYKNYFVEIFIMRNKKNYLGRLKYNDTEIFLQYNKIWTFGSVLPHNLVYQNLICGHGN